MLFVWTSGGGLCVRVDFLCASAFTLATTSPLRIPPSRRGARPLSPPSLCYYPTRNVFDESAIARPRAEAMAESLGAPRTRANSWRGGSSRPGGVYLEAMTGSAARLTFRAALAARATVDVRRSSAPDPPVADGSHKLRSRYERGDATCVAMLSLLVFLLRTRPLTLCVSIPSGLRFSRARSASKTAPWGSIEPERGRDRGPGAGRPPGSRPGQRITHIVYMCMVSRFANYSPP